MELRQLNAFVAVAEELHFGRAAVRCGLAAPALSRQIAALEQELGVNLLTRTTRQVALTRAGFLMLEEAKAIIARSEQAFERVRDAHQETGATLRIGAIDAASASFLSDIVAEFRRSCPAIDIRFVEAMTGPLLHMLETGKLDLCFIRPPRVKTDCAFEVLRMELPVVVLPTGHRLLGKQRLTMDDLKQESVVIPARRSRPYAYDLVMSYFESVDAVPRIGIEATEKPAMMAAVAAGLGIAIAPDWVARLTYPGVVVRKLSDPMENPPDGALVGVAWRPEQRFSARDSFLALLRERISYLDEHLAGAAAASVRDERKRA
jgi:DNA-binding transcriptional LysR family regulator